MPRKKQFSERLEIKVSDEVKADLEILSSALHTKTNSDTIRQSLKLLAEVARSKGYGLTRSERLLHPTKAIQIIRFKLPGFED